MMVMEKNRGILKKFEILWVSLYFFILTVVMTWPLVLRMRDSIVGQIGDNIYFIWMIGWVNKALFRLGVNPFDVWFLNYPEGWSLAYTEITPLQIALAMPFELIAGPTFGYNAAMLLTFFLSGLGMYLWVKRLTGKAASGLIAGTIFAFIPYHFAHFRIGHLNLSGTQWFPFYFMGFFELLQKREFGWKPAVLTGVMLGFIGLTSQYYLYMTLLVSAVLFLVGIVFYEREQLKNMQFWKNGALAVLVSLPIILAAVAPYVSLQQQGGLPDRNIGVVRLYSASPTDFLLPSTDHFLWGGWVGQNFNRDLWVEGTLYFGIITLVLAGIALAKSWQGSSSTLIRLLLWGSLLSIILAMGIDLHWNGESMALPVPGFLISTLNRETVPIPLPGFFLFHFFPFYAKLRALMRFGIFALVFASAAAGIGSARVLNKIPKTWSGITAAAIILLVFLDFYPGPFNQFAEIKARPVDYWLNQQPDVEPIVQMPFSLAEDQEQTYYTLIHEKPYVGGFFNAFPPAQYARIRPVLENFPDQESVDLVRELGVKFVLVEVDHYPDQQKMIEQIEGYGLKYLIQLENQIVFEFVDSNAK